METLLIGQAKLLGSRGDRSAIDKAPVTGRIRLEPNGLAGDEQGDRKHHGGPEKAVHHYPLDHYAAWRSELGVRDVLQRPGAFGENISTRGMTEPDVAVGDVFRLGSALVEVSQGRQPCWKLNVRFGVANMALRVQASGRTGWYYRVIEPGVIKAGDRFDLVERHAPDWTIHRIWQALYVDTLDRDELAGIAELACLSPSWRTLAANRLIARRVEDWSRRLEGDAVAP